MQPPPAMPMPMQQMNPMGPGMMPGQMPPGMQMPPMGNQMPPMGN